MAFLSCVGVRDRDGDGVVGVRVMATMSAVGVGDTGKIGSNSYWSSTLSGLLALLCDDGDGSIGDV